MNHLKIEDFLSKLCKDIFGGYASAQIQKARGLKKKIVNLLEKERKDVLDFCFILQESASIPCKNWLAENKFSQEKCGLVKIPNSKGMFGLYYDFEDNKNYRGIIKNEDSNEVSLSSDSER
nr:hypothetical protein [Chryseobacterium sp. POL2]